MNSRSRWAVLLAAPIAALFLSAPVSALAAAPPPSAGPAVQAEAVVKPSVVYITTHWRGWIRVSDGTLLSTHAFEADTSCSGFVANSSGYIVTAGHCVDDQTMSGGRGALIETLLADLVATGDITADRAATLWQQAQMNWTVEGVERGSPPERTVDVYQTVSASGIVMSAPFAANVREFKPQSQGDVALLKVESPTPMPALEMAPVAPDAPATGTEVISAGYPGSVTEVSDPKLEPSMKNGQVSSLQTSAGVPIIEISAANTAGMSGGPTTDLQGRVVGTVSFKIVGEDQAFNFTTATSTVQALLSRNSVSTQLSPADAAYRAGLADYSGGRYREAVQQFDQVLASEPGQAQAQQYRAKAQALVPTENAPSSPPAKASSSSSSIWLYLGIGVAVVVAIGLALVLVFRKRRPVPVRQAPQPPFVPGSHSQPPAPSPQPELINLTQSPPVNPSAPGPVFVPEQALQSPVEARQPDPTAYAPCTHCGTPHSAQAHFCAECGQPFASALQPQDTSPRDPAR